MVAKTYLPSFLTHPVDVPLLPGWTMIEAFFGSDSDLIGLDSATLVPYAFLARRECDQTHHVFFRGTIDRLEWSEDFEALHTPAPFLAYGSLMHAGFLKVYLSLATVGGISLRTRCDGLEVSCHGHSLGGALASIAAVHLCVRSASNTLWAAPRAFSPFAVNAIEQLGLDFTRFVNPVDLVPDVPPIGLGWAHVAAVVVQVVPKVKTGAGCAHSLQSYLNFFDASEPLEAECVL